MRLRMEEITKDTYKQSRREINLNKEGNKGRRGK
jgi:hypothetical protein